MDKTSNKYWTLCIYLALILTTLAVFQQLRNHDFINYDDPAYVSENPQVQAGLARDSIAWAFTTGHKSNWHPLTWLSHMLDCQLFGTSPGWHHLTNLLLHLTNTLLLFAVLKRMTGALWRSAFVAAAFALHPLHIESVAWIAERKDVLSTLFWMLTMWAYVRYAEHPKLARYLLTIVFFVLGLMAKPMLVTLPFVLLLLDYWPLGRFQVGKNAKSVNTHSQWRISNRLIREKVPFFIISLISSVVTFLVQKSGGAIRRLDAIPLTIRIANAFISYLTYIGKMIWSSRLAVFYPHPGDKLPMWQAVIAALLLLVISIWIIRLAPKRRYLLVGWLWYLVTLVPVIGLVQVGVQALADRYTYMPLTGLFIIIVWGLYDLTAKWRYRKIALRVSTAGILLALAICTHLQLRHWRNSITLFEHAIEVTSDNHIAHCNLGVAIVEQDKLDEAIMHFRQALNIKHDYVGAHYNLGSVLRSQGKLDEAIRHFRLTLQFNPDHAPAHNNMGIALQAQGKLDEAIRHYRQALQAEPDLADIHSNLGYALIYQGEFDEAVSHYRQALQAEPGNPDAHNDLGVALQLHGKLDEAGSHYHQALHIKPDFANPHNNLGGIFQLQGKLDEAISHYRQALYIKPDYADAHKNLGNTLLQQDKYEEAIRCFTEALRFEPDRVKVLNNLAWILATHSDPNLRDVSRAIELAERAAELTKYQVAEILDTLAVAYASAGRFDRAVTTAQTALALASAARDDKLANRLRRRLELYRQEKPYREPARGQDTIR